MKKYRCQGCGNWIDEGDLIPYFDTLSHPVSVGSPDEQCLPDYKPCGPVDEMDTKYLMPEDSDDPRDGRFGCIVVRGHYHIGKDE